jgi:hypothetical protein
MKREMSPLIDCVCFFAFIFIRIIFQKIIILSLSSSSFFFYFFRFICLYLCLGWGVSYSTEFQLLVSTLVFSPPDIFSLCSSISLHLVNEVLESPLISSTDDPSSSFFLFLFLFLICVYPILFFFFLFLSFQ